MQDINLGTFLEPLNMIGLRKKQMNTFEKLASQIFWEMY